MKSVLYFFVFFSLNAGILRADWSVSGVVVAEDKKRSKHRECSHTPEKRPAPPCWAASVSACWGSPQTPVRKEGKHMEKRTREIVLRVPVTPEERALIQQKMAQLHTKNFSAYARKMLIDGYIVHMDTSDIRAQTAELQKIGVNVNQIARRINSTGTVYAQDVEDIKGALNSTASRYFLKLRIFVVFSFRQSKTNSICPLSSFISLAFTNSAG